MFFLTNLTKNLSLTPQDLGINIRGLISKKIRELEGQVVGDHGYIVTIVEFERSGKGTVENDSGNVNYEVGYRAITYKPIKDEILDAIPVFVNSHGFFCKVGPLQIFVSQHMMSENWEFDSDDTWKNTKTDETIILNQPVRLKIMATRINSNEITALGQLLDFKN